MSGSLGSWLSQCAFALSAHTIPGYSGPFEAVREFLILREAPSLETLEFPLDARSPGKTIKRHWKRGTKIADREWQRPHRPPWTYPFDVLWRPHNTPDVWIAFDVLTIADAVRKSRHSSTLVVGWHVDFVPPQHQGIASMPYRILDKYGQGKVDLAVELSREALIARTDLHMRAARNYLVVPMGISGELHRPNSQQFREKRVTYVGSLDRRATAGMLGQIFRGLHNVDPNIKFDVVGEGEEYESLIKVQESVPELTIHGFLSDSQTQELLNQSTVGLAPYAQDSGSFSRFGDPGKTKMYLAAGLPIVTTPVPPNARHLADVDVALLVASPEDCHSWVQQVISIVGDPNRWLRMSSAAHSHAQEFTWNTLLETFFEELRKINQSGKPTGNE